MTWEITHLRHFASLKRCPVLNGPLRRSPHRCHWEQTHLIPTIANKYPTLWKMRRSKQYSWLTGVDYWYAIRRVALRWHFKMNTNQRAERRLTSPMVFRYEQYVEGSPSTSNSHPNTSCIFTCFIFWSTLEYTVRAGWFISEINIGNKRCDAQASHRSQPDTPVFVFKSKSMFGYCWFCCCCRWFTQSLLPSAKLSKSFVRH